MHVPNPNTKKKKRTYSIYKTYGTLKKKVDGNHVIIVKNNEEELNGLIKKFLNNN
jgi:hypothetical protein